jgi:hypothetical protein
MERHDGSDRNAFGTFRSHTRASFTGTVDSMDEAHRVLRRLRRIEALEREHAPVRSLLAEVHALVGEAEAWAAAEDTGTGAAEEALDRCREALAEGPSLVEGRAAAMS